MGELGKKLNEYAKSDYYPFHMPGHKRNMKGYSFADSFSCDITEIDGFDNLHQAEDVILSVEKTAARLFGSAETHLLVNGSTAGILAAISGCVLRHGKILLARNSHKAAYNALFLNELKGIFVYPKMIERYGIAGSIVPEDIEKILASDSEIEAVFITSPTYDGVVSDVEKIAKIVHKYKIPLIVDEAHGAHFGFYQPYADHYQMQNSVRLGADIVIQSLHKTLPSFTQTALIHLNGEIIQKEKIRQYLAIYQSSSPSYVFMAGMDQCFDILIKEGITLFVELSERLSGFYRQMRKLKCLEVILPEQLLSEGAYGVDPGKLLISTKMTDVSGKELYDRLRKEYHIQMEMAAGDYCLGIATIMDTVEGFQRLSDALMEIDSTLVHNDGKRGSITIPETVKEAEIYEALSAKDFQREEIVFAECEGAIAGDYIYAYPPGIPILAPGEIVSSTIIHSVGEMKRLGLNIAGIKEGKFTKGKRR